jgi:hypothetical protein
VAALAAEVADSTAAVEAASTVAGSAAASAAAVLAEAVSVQPLSEAAVSARPLSEAEVSAQPQLGAVDFAVEPSQAMVSAAVSTTGSTTMGADLVSVHLHSD